MEEWRKVEGFSDYEICNDGRIKSLKRQETKPDHIMAEKYHGMGKRTQPRPRVCLIRDDGVKVTHQVGWWVCAAWHGLPPRQGLTASHGDDNALNNHPDNLSWQTSSENRKNALLNGKVPSRRPRWAPEVRQELVRLRSEIGLTYAEISDLTGMAASSISAIYRRMTREQIQ